MSKSLGLNYVYRKIFKEKASLEANEFIKNLSWSFLGGIITSVIMFGVNIFIGRIIGPEQYGKYNLVLTISQLLLIPIIFGFEVSGVRKISKSVNLKQKKEIISTCLYFVLANIALLSILVYFLSPIITKQFDTKLKIVYIILIFASVIGVKQLLDSFMRGMGLFYQQFFGRIIELLISLTIFFGLFIYVVKFDYFSYIIILISGALGLIVFYIIHLRNYFSKFNLNIFKQLFSYGKIILLGSILGTVFNSLDKIIIARYLSITQLGVYSAYYMASTNFIAQIIQNFINVFFPFASKNPNKNLILKVNDLSKSTILPGTVVFSFFILIIMKIFGQKYGVNYYYVVSFGFLAVLQFIYSIYSYLIMAISKELYKKFLVILNLINILHIIAYGILIYSDKVSIQTIIVLFIINLTINILYQRKILYKELDLI